MDIFLMSIKALPLLQSAIRPCNAVSSHYQLYGYSRLSRKIVKVIFGIPRRRLLVEFKEDLLHLPVNICQKRGRKNRTTIPGVVLGRRHS